MDQGIAFARTLRALEADNFRRSKFGIAVAVILIGAWVWWFVVGFPPRHEHAGSVLIENGRSR
jgi:hypothetical protein